MGALVAGGLTVALAGLALVGSVRLGPPWLFAARRRVRMVGFTRSIPAFDTAADVAAYLRVPGRGIILLIGFCGANVAWSALVDPDDWELPVPLGVVFGLLQGGSALAIYGLLRWASGPRSEEPEARMLTGCGVGALMFLAGFIALGVLMVMVWVWKPLP